jgi:hypothetical protein
MLTPFEPALAERQDHPIVEPSLATKVKYRLG